jgi:hypothetical protein
MNQERSAVTPFFQLDRRRKVVVDPALQRRIVLSVSMPMVVILLIVLGAQVVFDWNVRHGTLDVDGRVFGLPERALSAAMFFVFATLWQAVHALKVSQRIAGSVHRIREDLRAYRSGDRDVRVRLRANDLHSDLAAEINATLDWVGNEAGQFRGDRMRPTSPLEPDRSPSESAS